MIDEDNSNVTAASDITISAQDKAPSLITGWNVPPDKQPQIDDALSGSPLDLDGNILAVMLTVAGSALWRSHGVFSGNVISNTIKADIVHSTVTSTNGKVGHGCFVESGHFFPSPSVLRRPASLP